MPHWISSPDVQRSMIVTAFAAAFLVLLLNAARVNPPASTASPAAQLSLSPRIQAVLNAAPELLAPVREFEDLEAVLKEGGNDAAWSWLLAHYTTEGAVIGKPYFLALRIGEKLAEAQGLEGIADCRAFKAACYHGVIGAVIAEHGVETAQTARTACKRESRVQGEYLSCVHAIGHGLASAHGFNLPPALAACERLDKAEREPCWDGVFMEYLFSAPPSSAIIDDPWYPCTAVPQRYSAACARRQAGVMRFKLGLDTPAIAAACKLRDQSLANPCLDSIGRYAGFASNGDIGVIRTICAATGDSYAERRCTFTAAIELALDYYPDADTGAVILCRELSGELGSECQDRLERVKASRFEPDNLY